MDSVLHLHVLPNKHMRFQWKNFEEIHIPQVREFLEDSIYYEQTKVRIYFDCYFFWFNRTLTGYKIIWHL